MNRLYDHGRNAFAMGDIKWKQSGGDNIKAILADSSQYTPNMFTDRFISDIPSAARYGAAGSHAAADGVNLILYDPLAGVVDADNIIIQGIPSGVSLEFVILYKWTGAENTSQLISLMDIGAGLPVTTNGSDIIIEWDNGVNKIFKL